MADPVILYSGPIVTRAEAKAAGLTRYFTGKPCPHGHICERWTSATGCVECARQRRERNPELNYARVKAWRKLHPEERTEEARRYRKKYPDRQKVIDKRFREKHGDRLRPIEAERARTKRRNDPEGNRQRLAKFKAKREQALWEIAGRPRPDICEICKEKAKIVFDHCHVGNFFRGWVCDRCNKVLGLTCDSVSLLRGLADYLERVNGQIDHERTK